MGKRLLSVSPDLFVAFLKETDGVPRTYSVESPLPDDTRVIGHEWEADWTSSTGKRINLIVESEKWWGDVREYVDTPYVTVRYGEPVGD